MAKIIFNLPDDQYGAFKLLSQQTGVTMSEMLRRQVNSLIGNLTPCGVITSGGVTSGFIMIMR